MSARAEWLESQIAPTKEAMKEGDGCHRDEAKALGNYLEGRWTAQQAAEAITAPVRAETDPPGEVYRLNGLLCDALTELPNAIEPVLDLVQAIQSLPPSSGIDWSDLPGFLNMWSDLNRPTYSGVLSREGSPSEARKAELQQHYQIIGTVEGKIYARGINGMTRYWAFEMLYLMYQEVHLFEVQIGALHGWLKYGGTKLKQELRPDTVEELPMLVAGSRLRQTHRVKAPLTQHWEAWRAELWKLSETDSLSGEFRNKAVECYEFMQWDENCL